MALNWDIGKCDGYKRGEHKSTRVSQGQEITGGLNPVLETIIHSTVIVGMGRLTADTVEEFADRLDFFQALNGPLMVRFRKNKLERVPVTMDDLVPWVGLTTNVVTEPRRKWQHRTIDVWMVDNRKRRMRGVQ